MRAKRSDTGGIHKPRKQTPFIRLPEPEKKSPDSLRFILGAFRKTYLQGTEANQTHFLRQLVQHWPNGRLGRSNIDRSIFDATESGTAAITYHHLEIYARALGIPAGAILLLSRIYSECDQSNFDQASDLLDRYKASAEDLRTIVDEKRPLTFKDIEKFKLHFQN